MFIHTPPFVRNLPCNTPIGKMAEIETCASKNETPMVSLVNGRFKAGYKDGTIHMLGEIASIRLRDLEVFEEVARARSIREAARRINTSSGQVSKSIQNLERLIGAKLFKRSASGVLLTSQGAELQTIVQDILSGGEKLESLVSGHKKNKFTKVIAIAGTSFLNTHFTTSISCKLANEGSPVIFRFLDLAPDQFVAVGLRGGFDISVHFGALSWPRTWTTKSLGKSRWTLCARANHPLPKRAKLKQILEYPFVVPTYWTADGLVRGNDQFPMPISKRKTGYETATADAAVPILLETNQIAFLPDLLASPFIKSQQLRELRMVELPSVEKELFLSAKSDVVPDAIFKGLLQRMSDHLMRSLTIHP